MGLIYYTGGRRRRAAAVIDPGVPEPNPRDTQWTLGVNGVLTLIRVIPGFAGQFAAQLVNNGPLAFGPDATLAAEVFAASDGSTLLTPTVSWIDPAAGTLLLSVGQDQTAGLQPGVNWLRVSVSSGEISYIAYDGPFVVAAPVFTEWRPFDADLYYYLTGKTGHLVYPAHIPESSPLPAYSYFRISGSPTYYLSGNPTGLVSAIYQIDAWSTDKFESLGLLDTVRRVISGYRGKMGSTQVCGARIQNEFDQYETDIAKSDDGTYHSAVECRFLYREPVCDPAVFASP